MKLNTRIARGLCAALLATAYVPALAHGSVRFGIGIGIPGPWYYPPPVYYPYPYYPPAVVVPAPSSYVVPAPSSYVVPAPSSYVEQAPATSYSTHPAQTSYYYCAASKSYYPYVRDCPGGWEQVPAQPR
jgi:hypothetical protein